MFQHRTQKFQFVERLSEKMVGKNIETRIRSVNFNTSSFYELFFFQIYFDEKAYPHTQNNSLLISLFSTENYPIKNHH